VAQNAILLFVPVKFNFSRKKSATKFLCVKTSSGKVVAKSFPYPTVDCGRRPHLPEIGVQSDAPLQKTPISKAFVSSSAVTAGTDTFCDKNLAQRI